jgi:hypothetical protein
MTPDPVEPVVEHAPVAAVEPPAAPAPTPPAAGDAPWAKDLATLFPDETVRTQVDTYLRANVQPHVTKLEQEYAPARKLWEDLQGDGDVDTFLSIAEQRFGTEYADRVSKVFEELALAEEAASVADPPPAAVLTPEQQANHEWIQAQRVESEYNSELARVKEAGVVLTSPQKEAWFANFVVGAEGNFDEAARRWEASGLANVPDAGPPPVVPPADPAPPTLGDGGGPVLPTEKKYASISDAVDDAMDDLRAAREAPAAVGQ